MVISAWSSGTGGAGVLGAGSFALLTHLGRFLHNTVFTCVFQSLHLYSVLAHVHLRVQCK